MDTVQNPDNPEWIPFKKLLLTDDDIKILRNGTNRTERMKLERKWSFSEIIKGFSTSDSDGLKLLVHLAHGYGMSSHLIHKDGDGASMVWERYGRSEEQRVAVKLGHCARVVSDICSFSMLRLYQLLTFCGKDTGIITEVEQRYELLFNELQKAGKTFTEVEYGEELSNQVD